MSVTAAVAAIDRVESTLAKVNAGDALDHAVADVRWRRARRREALNRARSSRHDLRDSRSALDASRDQAAPRPVSSESAGDRPAITA